MLTVLVVVLAGAPNADVECLPVPPAVTRLGVEGLQAYRDMLRPDVKAPRVSTAPTDARLFLRLIWTSAEKPAALATLMEDAFTWSFGGDASSKQALGEWAKDPALATKLRAAIAGTCRRDGDVVICAAKKGPRLVLEKQNACWRWTAFVEGD